jgi:murein L,D-transpeptidase YcbB/YkuD
MNRLWRRPLLAVAWLTALAANTAADTTGNALAEALAQPAACSARIESVRLAPYYETIPPVPRWLTIQAPSARAQALRRALSHAAQDGLDPAGYSLDAIHARWEDARPASRACLDVLLTAAFDRYSRDLWLGELAPAQADPTWQLRPDPFDPVAALRAATTDADFTQLLESLAPPHFLYQRLRAAYARHQQVMAQGGWQPLPAGPALMPGMRHAQVSLLRKRLRAEGDLKRIAVSFGQRYDPPLAEAVQRFQRRHGLAPDGVVGTRTRAALNVTADTRRAQMQRALERLRWLPRAPGARFILVNTAGFQLDVIENGMTVLAMRTINGTPDQATPSFSGTLQTLVINPYWYVPQRIARDRLWPRERAQPGYFASRGFRVFDTGGGEWREVDPASVAQALTEDDKLRVRQDPGPLNLMGRLSFVFPNPHDIFLHDTPERALFDQDIRTFSEGCVRIENAMALARYLLRRAPEWTTARIQTEIDVLHHQNLPLPEPLPVFVLYLPVWVADDGQVQFRDDPYQRERALASRYPAK